MGCFSDLLEGPASYILSKTSPRDSCRSLAISRGFRSAADSDAVWIKFLPSDFEEIISRSVSPVQYSTKKQLYFTLCDSPILLDGGKLSFALDKESGKKCYMLAARELWIVWGGTPQYWTWISLPESRFSEVAKLRMVSWLDIRGRMKTAMLSPNTTYSAYLVYKIAERNSRFEFDPSDPIKASVRSVGDIEGEVDDEYYNNCTLVCLKMRRTSRHVGSRNHRLPRERDDGWLEIELGEFSTVEEDEVEMQLAEIQNLEWKSGLIVEGIEVRPKVIK